MENQLTKEMTEVKTTLQEHSEVMAEIKAKLDECVTKDVYEKEMTEVKTTLQEHSEVMADIKAILKQHDEDIKDIKAILKQHDEDIKEIKAILKQHDEDIKELKEMMRSFQRTMLIVEDAVTNKIPALFDGYSMHQQKQEKLEGKVESLEKITQTHSIRIAALETISSNDTKRLSKMSS